MKQYHKGKIKDGILVLSNKQQFRSLVKSSPDCDCLLFLLKTSNRTQREWQEYYFAVLGAWSLDVGITKAELHELVKAELFQDLFDLDVASTTDMSNDEWNILMLNLENWLILKFENHV